MNEKTTVLLVVEAERMQAGAGTAQLGITENYNGSKLTALTMTTRDLTDSRVRSFVWLLFPR